MAHRLEIAPRSRANRKSRVAFLGVIPGLAALLLASAVQAQQAANPCGELANPFGPFEYRPDHYKPAPGDNTTQAYKLNLVESAHFTVPVQKLTAGNTASKPGHDLDYTLRAFPNNHRALVTVMNAAQRFSDANDIALPRPFECYFERALRFAPDDVVARLLYASFLIQRKQIDEAKRQIDYTVTLAGDNPISQLNIGMSYFDAGDYDSALKQAHIAAELGNPREDLKKRLQAIGRWSEPASVPTNAPAPSTSASAP